MQAEVIKEFQATLLNRKQELQGIILSNEQMLREQLNPEIAGGEAQMDVNHPADMVSSDPDYDKEIQIIRRQRAEMALVSSALARIDQGRFGVCEECHDEIPVERLRAVPYTKYCISCKEDKDQEAQQSPSRTDPHEVGNIDL